MEIAGIDPVAAAPYIWPERLARASASPTWSDPEGSSHNESRLGRCPASHLTAQEDVMTFSKSLRSVW